MLDEFARQADAIQALGGSETKGGVLVDPAKVVLHFVRNLIPLAEKAGWAVAPPEESFEDAGPPIDDPKRGVKNQEDVKNWPKLRGLMTKLAQDRERQVWRDKRTEPREAEEDAPKEGAVPALVPRGWRTPLREKPNAEQSDRQSHSKGQPAAGEEEEEEKEEEEEDEPSAK